MIEALESDDAAVIVACRCRWRWKPHVDTGRVVGVLHQVHVANEAGEVTLRFLKHVGLFGKYAATVYHCGLLD